MKDQEKLMLFENVRDTYVQEALESRMASRRPRKLALVAAVAAIACMLMGCAVVYAQSMGWFEGFFAQRSDAPLTTGQVQTIADKEVLVQESITQDGWTVELGSVMSDGNIGYIMLHVTAPEGMSLEDEWSADGERIVSWLAPGNGSTLGGTDVVSAGGSERVYGGAEAWAGYNYGYGQYWAEDGDGQENTRSLILTVQSMSAEQDVLGSDTQWHICLENFVRERDNEEYRQELMNGKHKGQTDVMFTEEEMEKLHTVETLVEGLWEFDVSFASSIEKTQGVELLEAPVSLQTTGMRRIGTGIDALAQTEEQVTLTSIRLTALSIAVAFDDQEGSLLYADLNGTTVVMKDGSSTAMCWESCTRGCAVLEAPAPIVMEEVDHILLPDGTVVPMPD